MSLLVLPRLSMAEPTMCGSKGSTPVVTRTEAEQLARYLEITAKKLTKEDLKERVARKLDLDEAKIATPVDALNHARWRGIMEEVFKDDGNKGGDDAERTQEGGNGGRKRRNGSGGDDAG
jgi:hypothetical protein